MVIQATAFAPHRSRPRKPALRKKVQRRRHLRYDMASCMYAIEHDLLKWRSGYMFWGMLTNREKAAFRRMIRTAIQTHLLTPRLKHAFAQDVLTPQGIPRFESALYQHLLTEWYGGKLKRLLQDLQHASTRPF